MDYGLSPRGRPTDPRRNINTELESDSEESENAEATQASGAAEDDGDRVVPVAEAPKDGEKENMGDKLQEMMSSMLTPGSNGMASSGHLPQLNADTVGVLNMFLQLQQMRMSQENRDADSARDHMSVDPRSSVHEDEHIPPPSHSMHGLRHDHTDKGKSKRRSESKVGTGAAPNGLSRASEDFVGAPDPQWRPEPSKRVERAEPSERPEKQRLRKRPTLPKEVDWKKEVSRLLGAGTDTTDDSLLEGLRRMTETAKHPPVITEERKRDEGYQVLHRIHCQVEKTNYVYVDRPYFMNRDDTEGADDHLRARKPVHNLELHIEKNRGLSFFVYKNYTCCDPMNRMMKTPEGPISQDESIFIIAPDLASALRALQKKAKRPRLFPDFGIMDEVPGPYLWVYHERENIRAIMQEEKGLKRKYMKQVALFLKYIKEHLNDQYEEVDKQLSCGKISSEYVEYLFVSPIFTQFHREGLCG